MSIILLGNMSEAELVPIEEITGEAEQAVITPIILGSLAMPESAKKTYAYLDNGTDQLVMDQYAYDFDVTTVPID